MPFDGALSGGKRYGAGQSRLSPSSFQKGSENGGGLKSNGTSNIVGFLERNGFMRLGKDCKDRPCMKVSLFTFYTRERT